MSEASNESEQKNNNANGQGFAKGTLFVNLWKGLSWFLLMGTGVFICFMPWLAASFGLVLPTILAGFTFPAMLALGLIIAIPSLMMMASSVLNICNKHHLAKFIKNIALGAIALAALTIGILLFAAPGLPIISAFAGMINGLGSLGALLTKIAIIALSVCKVADVIMDIVIGSYSRILCGATGKGFVQRDYRDLVWGIIINLPKIIRNLAIIALAIVVCCKLSLAVGLILAIPAGLKLIANFFDKCGNKQLYSRAKFSKNLGKGIFGAASLFMGISFLQPAVLIGFLGKLSFIAAAFPGILVAGIALVAFGVLKLAKTVTDVICGDIEKFKQGAYEIPKSYSKREQYVTFLDYGSWSYEIENTVPNSFLDRRSDVEMEF